MRRIRSRRHCACGRSTRGRAPSRAARISWSRSTPSAQRPGALIDLGRVRGAARLAPRGRRARARRRAHLYGGHRGELASALPALAAASRTVGSPQIRNRGTIGGNLGTASPAGDALPPLLVEDARSSWPAASGRRTLPLARVPRRPQAQRAGRRRARGRDPRAALARPADVHEGRAAQRDGDLDLLAGALGRSRARRVARGFGSAGPVVGLVTAPLDEAESFAEHVVAAASPIDDVRGTAAYRRHALGVLTRRALARCLV